MQILVTGGCGFIGSHYIRYSLEKYPDLRVVNVDSMTYAAHPDTAKSLEAIAPGRYQFMREDITSPKIADLVRSTPFDAIVNFAAETHVDRSILEPAIFVMTNIKGVENLLNAARKKGGVRFVQVSTDEVYGSLSPMDPKSVETSTRPPRPRRICWCWPTIKPMRRTSSLPAAPIILAPASIPKNLFR
jgi:dTDP-glucose 4,6-dehydratase